MFYERDAGALPKGWEMKKIGEVCENKTSNISIKGIQNSNGKYPIFGAKGFIKNIDFYQQGKNYISIIKDGAGIGRVTMHKPYSSTIATLQYIIPKKNTSIQYLYYFLSGFDFKKYQQGSTIPHIYFKDYSNSIIPIPPLAEQKRIVAKLNKVFADIEKARSHTERNLQNAGALFRSCLDSEFRANGKSWKMKKLGEVCKELFAGGDVPKNNFSKRKTKKYNIPIFSNGMKNKGLYGYTDIKKVTKASITISARGTIGYSEIRKECFYPVIRLVVLIPKNSMIDLSFLKFIFDIINFSYSGTSIPQLTIPMVKNYTIPVPPLPEQKCIAAKLDALSAKTKELEALYQKKLTLLDELKKSVLERAFQGTL